MADISEVRVENGSVFGECATSKVGSECTFEVCSIEDYKDMSEEEASEALVEAMWDSGYIEVYYK